MVVLVPHLLRFSWSRSATTANEFGAETENEKMKRRQSSHTPWAVDDGLIVPLYVVLSRTSSSNHDQDMWESHHCTNGRSCRGRVATATPREK